MQAAKQVFQSQYWLLGCFGSFFFYHNGDYGGAIEAAGEQGQACKHLARAWTRLLVVPEVIVAEDLGEDDEHDGGHYLHHDRHKSGLAS